MTSSTTQNPMPRLVLFTPAAKNSAIGRMTAFVTRELLSMGCSVSVVRTESVEIIKSDTHDFGTRITRWNDHEEVHRELSASDILIYQIGNSYQFHEGALYWIENHPGLVCLHDFFLGHLFYDWARFHQNKANSVLDVWYGSKAANLYFSHSSSESFIANTSVSMPMTEWICSQARGVVTHSQWGCDRVMNACPGPVYVVPLAYNSLESRTEQKQKNSRQEPIQLLTIGHINVNKRVENVIRAIGSTALLKRSVCYRLVGLIQTEVRNSLAKLAEELGVSLIISGEVDDIALHQAIEESDLVSCLRWPVLEAASASAIEVMLHGKAVIVTDAGFYKEIPDACALKISPYYEPIELILALEEAVTNPNRMLEMGSIAKNWATSTFTSENYAKQLLRMTSAVSVCEPTMKAIEHHTQQLSTWHLHYNINANAHDIPNLDFFKPSPRLCPSIFD